MSSVKTGYYRHCKFQRKPPYETLATWSTHNSCEFDCNEWNGLPNSRLLAVIKIFEIEKFLMDFVFRSTSSQWRRHRGLGSYAPRVPFGMPSLFLLKLKFWPCFLVLHIFLIEMVMQKICKLVKVNALQKHSMSEFPRGQTPNPPLFIFFVCRFALPQKRCDPGYATEHK